MTVELIAEDDHHGHPLPKDMIYGPMLRSMEDSLSEDLKKAKKKYKRLKNAVDGIDFLIGHQKLPIPWAVGYNEHSEYFELHWSFYAQETLSDIKGIIEKFKKAMEIPMEQNFPAKIDVSNGKASISVVLDDIIKLCFQYEDEDLIINTIKKELDLSCQ